MIRIKNLKYLISHILVIIIGAAFCLFVGTSCCLTFGYGLGDIAYVLPLWGISILYILAMIIKRKTFFKSLIPPMIYGIVLGFFIFNLIWNRGPECHCEIYQFIQ